MNIKKVLVWVLIIIICLALIFIFFNMQGYSVFEGEGRNNQEISGVRISLEDSSIKLSQGEDLELNEGEEDGK